ncbi:hypothetical protein DFR55_1684 [Herbinix hemicellulosilytica]|nr:hypothetical protein DFR55_1684 [Herbinix hemicellulosilytica]
MTGTGRFFYYKLKCWGCELNDSLTPTFIIEPIFIDWGNISTAMKIIGLS